jgi:hypothetical protein
MTRTQIQLPDELYRRAKSFAAERELSLAEVTRRGLELFLDRFPKENLEREPWKIPTFDGGGMLVPLEKLRDITFDEEANRSLPRP